MKKDLDGWIKKNWKLLNSICQKISKQNDVDDLFQSVIEQILKNDKFKEIEDNNERIYFFTRVARNNFQSRSSPYFYEYGRYRFCELGGNDSECSEHTTIEFGEEEEINLEWVNKQIDELKKSNEWYYGRLFEMYIDLGCSITELAKKTTIPINSVSRDINRVRKMLRQKRNKII